MITHVNAWFLRFDVRAFLHETSDFSAECFIPELSAIKAQIFRQATRQNHVDEVFVQAFTFNF